jgi:hypothetical protein
MTQIDADAITKGPGLYLRYLRDLRASSCTYPSARGFG